MNVVPVLLEEEETVCSARQTMIVQSVLTLIENQTLEEITVSFVPITVIFAQLITFVRLVLMISYPILPTLSVFSAPLLIAMNALLLEFVLSALEI